MPGPQVEELQRLSAERLNEFSPGSLPPPQSTAIELLDQVTADSWLRKIVRLKCPSCDLDLSAEQAARPVCPECGEAYGEHGGVTAETVYVRDLAAFRPVDWVVAIHGMNTTGAWQEAFTWHVSTTWGRAVPVAIYKYGIVIAGVVLAWRRRKLVRNLREKLFVLSAQAQAGGYGGKPDLIAHSFGTWLIGHLLEAELGLAPENQIRFGRVILTGSVLRPDFDWGRLKNAGLVDDVLNHFGSKDRIVPLAHATIFGSGPSGRRGFDGEEALNVRARGYGHSDLFAIEKCIVNGKAFQTCTGRSGETSHLEYAYTRYWRPFLTLPRAELGELPDQANPTTTWRQLAWPLRGTLFPFVALPLIAALGALGVGLVARPLWEFRAVSGTIAIASVIGLVVLLAAAALTKFWRRLQR